MTAGQIELGDLHNENVRRVLVEIEIAPTSSAGGPPAETPVLEFVLEYTAAMATVTTTAAASHGERPVGVSPGQPGVGLGMGGREDASGWTLGSSRSESNIGAAATDAPATEPERVEVVGTMALAFSDDRKAIPAEDPRVAAAVAIQSANDADDEVLALVAAREIAKAIAAKRKIVADLDVAVKVLEAHPADTAHGASAAVAAVLAKANAALEGLTAALNSGASDEIAQRMRYEQRVMRRMSDDGMDMDRADSECGDYSDDGDVDFRALQRFDSSSPESPFFGGSSRDQLPRRASSGDEIYLVLGAGGSGDAIEGARAGVLSGPIPGTVSTGVTDDVWPGPRGEPPPPAYTPREPATPEGRSTSAAGSTPATARTLAPPPSIHTTSWL